MLANMQLVFGLVRLMELEFCGFLNYKAIWILMIYLVYFTSSEFNVDFDALRSNLFPAQKNS